MSLAQGDGVGPARSRECYGNVDRFCAMMEEMARTTDAHPHHRPPPQEHSRNRLFGVTKQVEGVSQFVSVEAAERFLAKSAGADKILADYP